MRPGPLKVNLGKLRLDKGASGDDALNKMDYFPEGVVGKAANKKQRSMIRIANRISLGGGVRRAGP
ncbi:hypothetical protein AAKU55_001203 [Oxalobacteraceae bacterium GrIS 1.11]